MTAPERIWAWPGQLFGWMASHVEPSGPRAPAATEYVRADLPPTLLAAGSLPEVRALVEALVDIARQRTSDEIGLSGDLGFADFQGGYDTCVKVARAALGDAE